MAPSAPATSSSAEVSCSEVRVRSAGELARAEDLRRLGDWAVDSRDLDYLEL